MASPQLSSAVTFVGQNGGLPVPEEHALPALTLRHAQTDAHFEDVSVDVPDGERKLEDPGGLHHPKNPRFDSHNMLRSEEASDLLDLPEEEIWQKRNDPKESASSVTISSGLRISHKNADDEDASLRTPNQPSGSCGLLNQERRLSVPGELNKAKKELASPESDSDVGFGIEEPAENYSIPASIASQSKSAAAVGSGGLKKEKEKSLTRRLSSFLTRSFRRKSHGDKRVSYSAAPSERGDRPGSADNDTQRSLLDEHEYAQMRSQQLLRLGFSLNIDDALRNQPDSFLFVPLTDSGYFSGSFEQFEKLPQLDESVSERSVAILKTTARETEISALPPIPLKQSSNSKGEPQKPRRTIPMSASVQAYGVEKRETRERTLSNDDVMDPRRLSFIEGTSIMESINHLSYAAHPDYHGQHRSYDDVGEGDDLAPSDGKKAKQKLRFRRQPWKWIKSKF